MPIKAKTKPVAPAKKTAAPKTAVKKAGMTLERFAISGEKKTPMVLPFEPGKKSSQNLIAQALHVYQQASRHGNASTKTRGEVNGSTRKIYRQKGTGQARHGNIGAPIFVGGGIAFGPKPRSFTLALPEKMRRKALFDAILEKFKTGQVRVISDLESVSGKTKDMALFFTKFDLPQEKILFVMEPVLKKAALATRNISEVTIRSAGNLSLLDILSHDHIMVAEESMKPLLARFPKEKTKV